MLVLDIWYQRCMSWSMNLIDELLAYSKMTQTEPSYNAVAIWVSGSCTENRHKEPLWWRNGSWKCTIGRSCPSKSRREISTDYNAKEMCPNAKRVDSDLHPTVSLASRSTAPAVSPMEVEGRDCRTRLSMVMIAIHSQLRYRMKLICTCLILTQCATQWGWQLILRTYGRCSLTSTLICQLAQQWSASSH